MLDIQYIRDNPKLVEEKADQKGYKVDITGLLVKDEARRNLQNQADQLRRRRNELNEQLKGSRPSQQQQAEGRQLKADLAVIEEQLKLSDGEFNEALKAVPNMPLDDVPVGRSEDQNIISKTVGEPPVFDFSPRSHHAIGEERDFIDKTRAAKIAGSRFAYIKGDLVRLQFAIINFVISQLTDTSLIERLIDDNRLKLVAKPFLPVLPPAVLKTGPYQASARLNAEEMTYKIEQDDLWLNASAEHTLCTMYMDEIIAADTLPIRLVGYSTSFRREAGTYGKDMEGLIRLHQFDKLEMEVLSLPETGLDEHKLLIAIQEYLVQQLELPYQLITKCTADIGKPNASGTDINTWFPSQNAYRETHTADYMGDYQSRDLRIRARRDNGELALIHTNDATAFALGRIMAAIIENGQTADGRIRLPKVLQALMAQDRI